MSLLAKHAWVLSRFRLRKKWCYLQVNSAMHLLQITKLPWQQTRTYIYHQLCIMRTAICRFSQGQGSACTSIHSFTATYKVCIVFYLPIILNGFIEDTLIPYTWWYISKHTYQFIPISAIFKCVIMVKKVKREGLNNVNLTLYAGVL